MDLSFLDAREQAEVAFNIVYFRQFNHGTDAHHLRTLIAKLALQIEKLQNERKLETKDEYMD